MPKFIGIFYSRKVQKLHKKRRILLILFSIVCAFILWTSINLNRTFQTEIDIQLEVINLDQSLAIAIPLPYQVRAKIRGTGWQLLHTAFTPTVSFTLNLNDFQKRGTIVTSALLKEHSNLPPDIEIINTYPAKIELLLDAKITRTIPIQPDIDVNFRDGFGIVGRIITEPESVTITGARSLINTFQHWRTKKLIFSDVNTPMSTVTLLSDTLRHEISRSVTSSTLSFDVQPIAERTIEDIPIEIIQVPENKQVLLIPPKTTIIIRSGVNDIALLSEKDFHAFVDYRSILLDTSGTVQPFISGPDNVKIVQQRPERIQYVVRK